MILVDDGVQISHENHVCDMYRIRGAINKALSKFASEPLLLFRPSDFLFSAWCSFPYISTWQRTIEKRRRASERASERATRYRRKRVKLARRSGVFLKIATTRRRGSEDDEGVGAKLGVGSSRRKDRASYEIRLSYPPTPTAVRHFWRRRQPSNADTMVDSCCRRFLRVAFLRRVEHVGPAGFLLRGCHEKNIARDRRAPFTGTPWRIARPR